MLANNIDLVIFIIIRIALLIGIIYFIVKGIPNIIKYFIRYNAEYKYYLESKEKRFKKYNEQLDEIAADIKNYEKEQSE